MADVQSAPTSAVESSEPTGQELVPASTAVAAPDESQQKVRKIIRRKKRRPARVQVDPATFTSEPPPQTGVIFNIWYNKWSGGDRESSVASQTAAKGRCNIARDSGYTRADNIPGSFFCLFFARGLCPRGSECIYLHRLPTVTDIFNPSVDCFGRDKFSDYRDDMGGVGSFMRPNRTIYVGRIHVSDDIEEVVARHFAEWGQIERTRVLNNRGVAFVTYTNEANAQFAKEAMAHQSLDHGEVLNVRWATPDPNPMSQAREARRIEEQAAEAIRAALPAAYVAELEGREDPAARKRRRLEGSFGLPGYEAPDEVRYGKGLAASQQQQQQQQQLEAPSQTLAIEAGPSSAEAGRGSAEGGSGILSSAALEALRRRNDLTVKVQAPKEKPAGGLLVDYGSDEDEGD